jgi:hypothetical protein
MRHRLVNVLVPLAKMQSDVHGHERACEQELDRHGVAQRQHRDEGAEKWRGGETGAGAGGPELAQRYDEQRKGSRRSRSRQLPRAAH